MVDATTCRPGSIPIADLANVLPQLLAPLFLLGDTPISLARLTGFALIAFGSWWVAARADPPG